MNAKARHRRRYRRANALPHPAPWRGRPVDPALRAEMLQLIAELDTIPVDRSPHGLR